MDASIDVARKKTPKKQSGSETRKYTALVRMDREVADEVKRAAEFKGLSMAEFLTETLRPIAKKINDEWARKRLEAKGDK